MSREPTFEILKPPVTIGSTAPISRPRKENGRLKARSRSARPEGSRPSGSAAPPLSARRSATPSASTAASARPPSPPPSSSGSAMRRRWHARSTSRSGWRRSALCGSGSDDRAGRPRPARCRRPLPLALAGSGGRRRHHRRRRHQLEGGELLLVERDHVAEGNTLRPAAATATATAALRQHARPVLCGKHRTSSTCTRETFADTSAASWSRGEAPCAQTRCCGFLELDDDAGRRRAAQDRGRGVLESIEGIACVRGDRGILRRRCS